MGSEVGVLKSVGEELVAESGPIESRGRTPVGLRDVWVVSMAGPGKTPDVCAEAGESPETEGVSAALAADGLCLRSGFLGGSPGLFESTGEAPAAAFALGLGALLSGEL